MEGHGDRRFAWSSDDIPLRRVPRPLIAVASRQVACRIGMGEHGGRRAATTRGLRGGLSSIGRASDCGSEGCGFEPRRPPHCSKAQQLIGVGGRRDRRRVHGPPRRSLLDLGHCAGGCHRQVGRPEPKPRAATLRGDGTPWNELNRYRGRRFRGRACWRCSTASSDSAWWSGEDRWRRSACRRVGQGTQSRRRGSSRTPHSGHAVARNLNHASSSPGDGRAEASGALTDSYTCP